MQHRALLLAALGLSSAAVGCGSDVIRASGRDAATPTDAAVSATDAALPATRTTARLPAHATPGAGADPSPAAPTPRWPHAAPTDGSGQ